MNSGIYILYILEIKILAVENHSIQNKCKTYTVVYI
jgi:hypothetical protein